MANKSVTHSYSGMMQDIAKSKFSNSFYFEGKNIRVIATDSQTTGSVTNEKGNALIFQVPTPVINRTTKVISYGNKTLSYTTNELTGTSQSSEQKIVGHSNSRQYIILFTTDDNGFDCIWKIQYDNYDITLLYLRDLSFSTNYPIQVINNFENKNIDKVYWVDGNSQLRFLNIEHSIANEDLEELINVPVNVIDMVGKYNLSQPVITSVSLGGIHTSGMIQYGYNLYRLNSSQTKISPLSQLISLDKQSLGGGEVNEVVGASPIISINNIDTSFTNIRVYAVKYTSYNESPSISIIDDRKIPSTGNIELYDDGNIISTLSLEEFLFLGSDIVVPKHINTKFNRLFLANYKEINFNVDLDCRAYSFNNSGSAIIYKNLYLSAGVPSGTPFTITTDADYTNDALKQHDSVNLNYNTYKYQKNGSTYGGEGKYLKYELTQSTFYNKNNRYFKDEEIYRIGITFYNSYGQYSQPNWIADFKSREGNLRGYYNTLKVTLKSEFFTWLSTNTFESEYDRPVGYKIVIANRTINDRTIVANGLLSTMMVNYKTTDEWQALAGPGVEITNSLPKLPNIVVRNCNATTDFGSINPVYKCSHLHALTRVRASAGSSGNTETQMAYYGDRDSSGRFWQFNSMLQMYSPEIMFGNTVSVSNSTKLRIKGTLKNAINYSWGRIYNTNNNVIVTDGKVSNGLSPFYSSYINTTGELKDCFQSGFIGQKYDSYSYYANHQMYYRGYGDLEPELGSNTLFTPTPSVLTYDIYGKPEVTEKGQGGTNYNNDPNYRYINSLESCLTDGDSHFDNPSKYNRKIVSVMTYGNRCITLVPGNNTDAHNVRPRLETIFADGAFTGDDNGIIAELVKTDEEIYLGNIYGGNSYEDKLRTDYIEIGDFLKLDSLTPTVTIESPGDTYVNNFRFARLVRTDTSLISEGYVVNEEIVDFITETTVDLKNRNDLSLNSWDTRFQPQDAEYHKYNKVYSQNPTLIKHRNLGYNVKRLKSLDANIISTKLKSAGEIIDSWTDVSVNDVMTLDGKHGSINSLASFNDEIYAIQDKALAFISINPRVQVQGQDGLAIQLGTGNVLDRYKYVSTTSGTINKWSVVSSPRGLYYYDALNKSIGVVSDAAHELSDEKGLHIFFLNNSVVNQLKIDNPLLKAGVASGYDYLNNDVFFTFHQGDKSFTISYNEGNQQFISLYDYMPSMYISKGEYFITTDPSIKKLYRQYAGEYNKFYEVYYPSSITFNVNPEPNSDCVFDNINFKSEVYLNNVDQFDKTITSIQAYNDYQDSGVVPLVVGRNNNLRRKFRDWHALIPKQGRNRVRAPWIKLKLSFQNTSNYKFVMHDMNIYYTV